MAYNSLLDYFMASQPSAGQSIASALPFLSLPKKQKQYLQPAQNAIAAMGDTSNPMYQKIYGQQKQRGQQNLAESVAELVRQNRKQTRLGRTAVFDPSRGGETLFRGITRGYQDIQNQAADDTRNILGNQAKNYFTLGQQQSQLAGNRAGIKGNLAGALAKLFGL